MTDPSSRRPDWDAIFRQARGRILRRIAVVGAIAGVGALFLLTGGLTAQGTVTWKNVFGQSGDAKSDTKGKRNDTGTKSEDGHDQDGQGNQGNGRHGNRDGHDKKQGDGKKDEKNKCGKGSAESEQYCDSPDESGVQRSQGESTRGG